ncbi:acidic leucine-rich nuclear phosphoprotein 32 family member A, partial [Tanacetum coccineum]
KLPHNYESWEKLPEADKASIIPSLEGYFNLRPHLNDETTIMVNGKKKTIGSMVHAGLRKDFQDRYSDNKFKFKRRHFTKQPIVKDARDNKPFGWQLGDDEWQKLIDYWLDLKQMAKSTKNAQHRSKNKTSTYQGSKSYAQDRHKFFKKNKRYEDLVDHWRRTHTDRTGRFHSGESEELYEEADRLRKENEELKKAVQSQQLEWLKFVNHFNAHQTGTSSQYPVPSLYIPQAFSSPGYTPPNLDGYRPTYEDGSTSQIVHLDGDDLDVDGDGSGSLDGDGSGSLDGSDSDDDSNDASDEE